MKSVRAVVVVGVLSFALPAWASVWFTNRTAATYTVEIACKDKGSEHTLEGNTTANYALPKGEKTCQVRLKDGASGTLLSTDSVEDGARYEVTEGGKLKKR